MTEFVSGELFLDQYVITAVLGSGGMATVYKATDSNLDRQVAIKVLHRELAPSSEVLGRFNREAKIMATLDHARIARIYRYGVIEENQPFIIMEYVQAPSLRKLLDEHGPLPWWQAVDIAINVAEAMQYAHDNGVVHRDLTPNNILVQNAPQGKAAGTDKPAPKIVDFGLSNITSACQTKLTTAGNVLGTASYMSPEQCRALPTDGRTDIYALGCTIYECVCGRKVFDGETAMAVFFQQVQAEPLPLGEQAAAKTCPPELNTIVLKCLSKDPADRYQSMTALKTDLELLLAGRVDEIDASERAWYMPAVAFDSLIRLPRLQLATLTLVLACTLVYLSGFLPERFLIDSFAVSGQVLPVRARIDLFTQLGDYWRHLYAPTAARAAYATAYRDISQQPVTTLADCHTLALYMIMLQNDNQFKEAGQVALAYLKCLSSAITKTVNQKCKPTATASLLKEVPLHGQLSLARSSLFLGNAQMPYALLDALACIDNAFHAADVPVSALTLNQIRQSFSYSSQEDPLIFARLGEAACNCKWYDSTYYYLRVAAKEVMSQPKHDLDVLTFVWPILLKAEVMAKHEGSLSLLAIQTKVDDLFISKKDTRVETDLAYMFSLAGEHARAERLLLEARKQQGGWLSFYQAHLLAKALLFQSKFAECARVLASAPPVEASHIEHWRHKALEEELALVQSPNQERLDKFNYLAELVLHQKNHSPAYFLLAEMGEFLIWSKHYPEAEAQARKLLAFCLRNDVGNSQPRLQIARALTGMNQFEGAQEACQAAIRFYDSDYLLQEAYQLMSILCTHSGHAGDAERYRELSRQACTGL